MYGEDFMRDFFGLPQRPPRTSFSDWVTNPRTQAMFERDSSQLAEIRKLRTALAAADVLAHQFTFTPYHDRYWQARGGHDACTVCNPTGGKG